MTRRLLCAALTLLTLPAFAQTDPVPTRANALLARMTLEEKIGQLGSLLFVSDPKEINRFPKLAAESRLKIPLLFGYDVICS